MIHNKSRARHHRSLKLGSKLKYLSIMHYPKNQQKTQMFVLNIGLPIIKGTVKMYTKFLLTLCPFFLYPENLLAKPKLHHEKQMIGKSDSESVIHERKKQLDKISLRELLTELYHGLNVTVVNKNDSIISTQIPPRMFFN